jgi:hypothetical protein
LPNGESTLQVTRLTAFGKIQTLEQQLDKADELINTLYESGDLKIYMEELVQAHLTAYNV